MNLTAEQRYRQAVRKAHIRGQRNLRLMMEGKADFCPCSDPRADIIAEIDRAYQAGFADGAQSIGAKSPVRHSNRSAGGHARAAAMTPEQRAECARAAALARWTRA